jgi:hypothetical protein
MPASIVPALKTIILRELRALDREIAAYPDDESLWTTPAGAPNSAGNLACVTAIPSFLPEDFHALSFAQLSPIQSPSSVMHSIRLPMII